MLCVVRWSRVLLLKLVEPTGHPSLKWSPAGLLVYQNSFKAIMSCPRVDLKLIVGGQGLLRSKKQKSHREGWPDCMLRLAPRVGFESTTCELTVVFPNHYWRKNQLNQFGNYTASGVNMLRIDEPGAENRSEGAALGSFLTCITSKTYCDAAPFNWRYCEADL